MFQLVKSEVLPLTPELAQQFRDMDASATERQLRPDRLKMLHDKADAGLLINFNWCTALLNGKRLRVNGQHSSRVLCELNGTFPAGLKVHHDEYKVDNEDDLVLLYRQFDVRKSGRGADDVSWYYQALYPELRDVLPKTAKHTIESVAWYQRTVTREPTPNGDDVYTMFNHKVLHPFIIWVGKELFDPTKTPELKTKGVFGAMYATFIANTPAAKEFWHAVGVGEKYDDTAPATVLDQWLVGDHEAEKKDKHEVAEHWQGCTHAWNAFRDGKAIKAIRFDTTKGWNEVKA